MKTIIFSAGTGSLQVHLAQKHSYPTKKGYYIVPRNVFNTAFESINHAPCGVNYFLKQHPKMDRFDKTGKFLKTRPALRHQNIRLYQL